MNGTLTRAWAGSFNEELFMKTDETPTGLSPFDDSPAEKRTKVQAGKGLVWIICGVAVAAFALYAFTVVYGIIASGP